jgi:pyruvyltransferase
MQIKCHYHHKRNNFGDMLTPFIIEYYTGKKTKLVDREYQGKILACGSILGRALRENDFVWGTGAMSRCEIVIPKGVKIYAVRGPLTRRLIKGKCPEVYGDPGLLLPEIYNPNIKASGVGLLPHFDDYKRIKEMFAGQKVINIKKPVKQVIDEVKSCKLIITSSLHGLITAEAYGIPVIWAKIMKTRNFRRMTGEGFKFNDYLLSTGRTERRPTIWTKAFYSGKDLILSEPKINTEPLKEAFKEMMEAYMAFDK